MTPILPGIIKAPSSAGQGTNSQPKTMSVATEAAAGLKRKSPDEASPLDARNIKKARESSKEFSDLPLEVTELIASYLPKRDIASFGQTSKLHRDLTDPFWTAEVKREGFDVFSKIDPTFTGKSEYLFTRAIFKFLSNLGDQPLQQSKSIFLKGEYDWVKNDFPKLHSLFLYMIYETTPLYFINTPSNLQQLIPQYRTSNIFENSSGEIRQDIYQYWGRDTGASILQLFIDLKYLPPDIAFHRFNEINCPIADFLTMDHAYNDNSFKKLLARRAAEKGDFRPLDRLFELLPSLALEFAKNLEARGHFFPPVLVQLAIEAQNEGRLDEAKDLFMEALNGYGSSIPLKAFILLAKFNLQCNQPEEAEAAVNKAMESFSPRLNSEFLSVLYDVKSTLGKWDEAEKMAADLVQTSRVEFNLGLLARARLKQGKYEEANQIYDEVTEYYYEWDDEPCVRCLPYFAEAAFVKMNLNTPQYAEAEALFSKAIDIQRLHPDGVKWGNKVPSSVLANIATNKMHLEKWLESDHYFSQALIGFAEENSAPPIEVIIHSVFVKKELKKYDEAHKLLSKAIESQGGKSRASPAILQMMSEIEGLEEEGD